MGAKKGTRPPAAGMGRRKGVPNKFTGELREMILGALQAVGGQDYLEKQALERPEVFVPLLGKLLPKDISVTTPGVLRVTLDGLGPDNDGS